MSHGRRGLRSDLPFRHVALVLSGGGALGAYEVGVLKVLERLALAPALIAGVSSGALNAVVWLAHGFRTEGLERVWLSLRPSSLGMRRVTLLLRALGALTIVLAVLEVFLTLAGSPELGFPKLFGRPEGGRAHFESALLDALAWVLVGVVGGAVMLLSRQAEGWLAKLTPIRDPERWYRWLGRAVLAFAVVHLVTLLAGLPWPHRFSATALAFGVVAWIANRPGLAGQRLRALLLRLLPETGGRGLWGGAGRRLLVERLLADGDPARLVSGPTRLLIGALALDSGRTCHFVNWREPSPEFRARVERALGEVALMTEPEDVIEATVASSAIPGIFEPVRIADRDFTDPGGVSNQPLHAAIAEGADAVIVVLLSPSERPSPTRERPHLITLGGRLLEIANWRDLQTELRSLPGGWSRSGHPARVCVVEPEAALPGGVMGFDPANAAELIRRGEADAWSALERAGWLAAPGL